MRPGLDPEPRTHPYGFRPLGATNLNLRRRNLRSLDLRRRNLGTCTLVAGVNLRRRNLLDLNLRRRNSVRLELNRRRRKSVGQPLLDLQLSFARRALDQLVEVRRIEMRRQQANSDQMEPAIGDGLEELGELASSPRGLNPLERRVLRQAQLTVFSLGCTLYITRVAEDSRGRYWRIAAVSLSEGVLRDDRVPYASHGLPDAIWAG